MQHCESINLDEYRQSGEGGTAITYKHNSRNSLAKLYKSGFEADMAIEEFKVAQAVYDLGIPTPKPYRLVTDGERLGAEYEFISGKRSFARILPRRPWSHSGTLFFRLTWGRAPRQHFASTHVRYWLIML